MSAKRNKKFSMILGLFLISLLLGGGLLISAAPGESDNTFAGGSGTEDDPYLISTAEQLDAVRHHLDKNFLQTTDIDLADFQNNSSWEPIKEDWSGFSGTFNGNGFSISGLFVEQEEESRLGLFSTLEVDGFIKNVTLKDATVITTGFGGSVGGLVGENRGHIINCSSSGHISGSRLIGGLVGFQTATGVISDSHSSARVEGVSGIGGLLGINYGEIYASHASGKVTATDAIVGGLVGNNREGIIFRSYATGNVEAEGQGTTYANAGGLVGDNNEGQILESMARGDVEAEGLPNLGGLVGFNRRDATISDCYARGSISGFGEVGGLVGTNTGSISRCYATGSVEGFRNAGGLVGADGGEVCPDSFFDRDTSGQEDDETRGVPLNTDQMFIKETFSSWDFLEIWGIEDGEGYPFLLWEKK